MYYSQVSNQHQRKRELVRAVVSFLLKELVRKDPQEYHSVRLDPQEQSLS
jgi:hypothetical protein